MESTKKILAMKETIDQLKQLLGDEFSALVNAFEQDNRKHLKSIEQLIDNDEAEQVSRQVHSIKGASSNLGAIELASVCQQLEAQAKDGDLSNAKELLAQIHQEFEKAIKILREV